MTLTNADIVGRLKLLGDYNLKADSGTLTTCVSKKLISEADLQNQYICFTSGSNAGVDRIILDFFDSTGTITFDTLDNAVTNTDEFSIIANGYLTEAAQAETFMKNDFRNRGYNIDLFLTVEQIKEAHIYKTLEIICRSKMNDGVDTDVYFIHYNAFKELYKDEMSHLIADYDSDESGDISEGEELQTVGQVFFKR